MASMVPLASHDELSQSRYIVTLSTGKRLVLFRLPTINRSARDKVNSVNGWTYYAMEQECPHAGGPMSQAQIDIEDSSYVASCPWHAYDFNLETGSSSYGVQACTYPVISQNGLLMLELQDVHSVTMAGLEPVSEKVKYKHDQRAAFLPFADPAPIPAPTQSATLCDWCVSILNTADPERKIELTNQLFSLFASREASTDPMQIGAGTIAVPDEPLRPSSMQAVKPWQTPTLGKGGTLKSRINMLHAIANIEQWAIDLAIDICARFASFMTAGPGDRFCRPLPRAFFYDWLRVANDEAKHFSLLRARLEELGSHFGALPVHHGLWESAWMTRDDLRARISVIALVHEARGLDVNPHTIEKFRKNQDLESVEALEIIHNDEITHVTTGHRWLSWICEQEHTDPVCVFRAAVVKYFRGAVKGPFNVDARQQAGMHGAYYEDLTGSGPVRSGHVVAGG